MLFLSCVVCCFAVLLFFVVCFLLCLCFRVSLHLIIFQMCNVVVLFVLSLYHDCFVSLCWSDFPSPAFEPRPLAADWVHSRFLHLWRVCFDRGSPLFCRRGSKTVALFFKHMGKPARLDGTLRTLASHENKEKQCETQEANSVKLTTLTV